MQIIGNCASKRSENQSSVSASVCTLAAMQKADSLDSLKWSSELSD